MMKPPFSPENMKKVFLILGVLCLIASAVMYFVGNDNSRLSELKDFFWAPLPLGVILVILGLQSKKDQGQ